MSGIKGRGYPVSQGLSQNRPPARVAESSPRRWRTSWPRIARPRLGEVSERECVVCALTERRLATFPSVSRSLVLVGALQDPSVMRAGYRGAGCPPLGTVQGVRQPRRPKTALPPRHGAARSSLFPAGHLKLRASPRPSPVVAMRFSRYSARDVRHSSSFDYSSSGVTSESMVTP